MYLVFKMKLRIINLFLLLQKRRSKSKKGGKTFFLRESKNDHFRIKEEKEKQIKFRSFNG